MWFNLRKFFSLARITEKEEQRGKLTPKIPIVEKNWYLLKKYSIGRSLPDND